MSASTTNSKFGLLPSSPEKIQVSSDSSLEEEANQETVISWIHNSNLKPKCKENFTKTEKVLIISII